MPVLPIDVAFYRAISSLQRGDLAGMSAAIDRGTARSRELSHAELSWHCARFRAIARINEGALADGVGKLEALHIQAQRREFYGTLTFCAFDRALIFGDLLGADVDESLSYALLSDASDPPSIWSLKLRAVATMNMRDDARALLHRIAVPSDLARLPCDTHYLGTLGHVAQAALKLGELDYAEAAYQLLAPFEGHIAAHISFLSEGPVAQVLGTIARALGRTSQAIVHLEEGIRVGERIGFAPRAAQAKLELARCLLERGLNDDRPRALLLAREADTAARRLGMRQLARETATFLAREGAATAQSLLAH